MISKEAADAYAAAAVLNEIRAKGNDSLTEDSVALAFRDRYAGELVYDHEAGGWYRREGAYWRKESTEIAFDWRVPWRASFRRIKARKRAAPQPHRLCPWRREVQPM